MKQIITLILLISSFLVNAQSISCEEATQYIIKNLPRLESQICFSSSMLTKVEYYKLNSEETGYVVAYIKQNDNDIFGKPYLFCGISLQRWQDFKFAGIISWGEAFHKYIINYTCNCE